MTAVLVTFGGYAGTHAGAERMAWRTSEHLARQGHCVHALTDSRPPDDLDPALVHIHRDESELDPGPVQADRGGGDPDPRLPRTNRGAGDAGPRLPRTDRGKNDLDPRSLRTDRGKGEVDPRSIRADLGERGQRFPGSRYSGEDPDRAWRADIVHAYDLAKPRHIASALRLAGRCGARLALTPATAPELWPDRELGRIACRRAGIIYALTEAEAGELRRFGAESARIRQIPHAPDLCGEPEPDRIRDRLCLGGPVVVFAGRRIPSKGYAELLRAAPLVWRTLPETRFVFLGPDGDPAAAETFRAHADPRILDLGVVDEPTKRDVLAAGAVLCLPTSADVFPLVFLEAWASGIPVVTGDFPGVHDIVADGVDGLVVTPRPTEIAAALVRLLTDEPARRAMGRAGQTRVRADFTWDRVAERVAAGYAEIRGTT
ncbi:glycosyltransferase family 4 protein [Nocardia sp. NPDC088792]|uniref:glycosyltransferase family 4 protein n=1 Tax=Nocardia sp. NPDC088792 TaxID=3364332 RepID=UPI0038115FDE